MAFSLLLVSTLALSGCKNSKKLSTAPPIVVLNPEPSEPEPPEAGVDMNRRDAASMDARVPDLGVDAAPVDMTVDTRVDAHVDAAPLDMAVPVDAAPVDMAVDAAPPFVWPPEECEGVVIPPVPDSPDGSEVCNYRDDDGDGLVDEGHGYVNLGFRTAVPRELISVASTNWTMIATSEGYVVAWKDAFGAHLQFLDQRGCATTGDVLVSANPNAITMGRRGPFLAYNGGRVAMVFAQQRPLPDGGDGPFSTWLQLATPGGELVGEPINLTPDKIGQGNDALIPFEDDKFAIFASTANPVERGFKYGELIIVDRDGQQVGERLTPFDGQRAVGGGLNGMAYGDGHFALAWQGGFGIIAIFNRAGEMRALEAVRERMRTSSGVAWTGRYFTTGYQNKANDPYPSVLPLFDLDGAQPENSPVRLTNDEVPYIRKVAQGEGGFISLHNDFDEPNVRSRLYIWRFDETAQSIAPRLEVPLVTIDVSRYPGHPIADLRLNESYADFVIHLSGCRGQ